MKNSCLWLMALLLSAFGSSAQQTTPSKPNILVILTDDQGFHDVSYYGTSDLRTPHIDQLAREGMRFDNFYANSTVCSPTRAALLSGRYQDQVGVPGVIRTHADNSWGYLAPQTSLLPAQLKKAGYHTAIIGKWHLGLQSPNTPNEHGFDYFHGWLGDMMDDYWLHRRHDINYMRKNSQTIDPKGHATDLFTQWSVDYIQQQAEDAQPFFLYLAYNAPHTPVQPPTEWVQKVKARQPGISPKRAELVALIEHMDDGIGKVIAALKESGQYTNTLIVFTSDNGGYLPSLANNGPTRNGKGSMYEGGLRVPASIVWPGQIKPGSVSDQVNLSMDVYPTLLEVAGITPDVLLNGRSFLPTLRGQSAPPEERPLYFTRREGGTDYAGQCIYALRLGSWKLLQNTPYEPMELYNLDDDPLEKKNVRAQQPAVYKKLNGLLMQHMQQGGKVPWQKPDPTK
ncbi:sulfatase family protein [Arundinibacter roseus]|uniref:N-acetylgalactosamine 6-sulfate sulfatase n=1 Tax=Arundinibacter roseus TaxID=2070510 RepID=A0A4R4KK80_9BACT|nr:sulfatase-like hydrolase/transferase [Arundinibacter roseus]TDB67326.1 N-acetylgalactosamine 6-sulfate sulfatase [Arundinibacter roseus]